MEDCYVQFIMSLVRQVPFYVPPHNHNCSELVYYITGTGRTTMNGKTYTYKPGTFAMIPPKTVHDETAWTDTELIYMGYLYNSSQYTFQPGMHTDHGGGLIRDAVTRMQSEWVQKEPFYSYKMNNIMQEILIAFFRRNHAPEANENSRAVQYIKQYIDEYALDILEIKEIAEMTGYSYDWLRHLFKDYTGQSLSQYIRSRKLQRAALLLRTTKKTVEEIAEECQFSSSSRFIDYFKREKGITPARFRKTADEKENVQWSFDV